MGEVGARLGGGGRVLEQLQEAGAGAVVLKRVEDAREAGDRVYAVIRGTGSASDGRAVGVLAPSSGGQIRALERAYADADVDPDSISFLEAHGTGTPAGDLAEIDTIAAAELENSVEQKLGNGNEPRRVAKLNGTASTAADTPDSDMNRSRIVTRRRRIARQGHGGNVHVDAEPT